MSSLSQILSVSDADVNGSVMERASRGGTMTSKRGSRNGDVSKPKMEVSCNQRYAVAITRCIVGRGFMVLQVNKYHGINTSIMF